MRVGLQAGFAAGSVLTALLLAGRPESVGAEAPTQPDTPATEKTTLLTDNPTLRGSLDRLFARSAAWRGAIAEVRKTGRRAVIVTPERVRVADAQGRAQPFDHRVLAEVQPMPDENLRVDLVVVVVNLPLLGTLHASQGSMFEFDADLDSILAHEIYGHAVPYLLAGDLSGKCADPRPGQPAYESCAVRRENEVRNQLGLGPRMEYGLNSLAVARGFRH